MHTVADGKVRGVQCHAGRHDAEKDKPHSPGPAADGGSNEARHCKEEHKVPDLKKRVER
jgi:hypothetical protein